MLNITAQANAAGAKAYFAQSDYYAEGQEIVGEWSGKGAALLGLSGQVDKRAFDSLCDNFHPQTDNPLTRITRSGRRVGYDFTWSAPKSISVVHALTGDESIAHAFRDSIRETMTDMEAEMEARVRKGKQDFDRTTGNLCWAEFIHFTSRPVKGIVCPQLHVHAFAFNATHDAAEGQWKAGQFGKLKEDAYYWQAVQQTRFAGKLEELGYSISKTKDAFEIEGVPDSVLKKFSLRTSLIERVADKLGITNPKTKAKLGATTREAKDGSVPYDELVAFWESQLTKEEASAIGVVAEVKAPKPRRDRSFEHTRFAIDHVFERTSVVDERRLLTVALRHGVGEATPEGVQVEMDRHGLLKREEKGTTWVTTPEVLTEEGKMIGYAIAGKASCKPLAGRDEIQLMDDRLNEGQRRAVTHVLTSADKIVLIRGAAGSGKTDLTKEAVAQIEERGKPVVMLAPSAQASRGVLRDEGFDEADTLSRFLIDDSMQKKAQNGVIFLDEAGLVGTPTMVELFHTADRVDARLVLLGDKRQLGSVERGASLRVLEDLAGLPTAEVTEIQRQRRGDYKEAISLLSKGRATDGFKKLDAMGCVKLMPVWDSYEPIAKDFVQKLERADEKRKDKAVMIVCPTHAEGRKITDAVRRELKARGHLDSDEREFPHLVPLHWTEAERGDASRYSGNEVLQFHHNSGPYKAGQRVWASDVIGKDANLRAKHFSVLAQGTTQLAAGDMVRLTGNGKTLDGRHKLNNGAVYRVAGFTSDGDISLSNGWVMGKELGTFSHGYVSTNHAAQGRTVEHVIVAQSAMSYPASSQEGFYVAASRGKQSVTIYTDNKAELREAIQRSDRRMSATELISKPSKPPTWQRMRQTITRIQQAAMIAAKQVAQEWREPIKEQEHVYER